MATEISTNPQATDHGAGATIETRRKPTGRSLMAVMRLKGRKGLTAVARCPECGRQREKSGFASQADGLPVAQKMYDELLAEHAEPVETVAAWLADTYIHLRERLVEAMELRVETVRRDMLMAARFSEHFPTATFAQMTTPFLYPWALDQNYDTYSSARAAFTTMRRFVNLPGNTNPFSSMGITQGPGRQRIVPPLPEDIDLLQSTARRVLGPWEAATMASMIGAAAWSAMRPGELLAAKNSDIDGDTLDVQRANDRSRTVHEPKPKRGGAGPIILVPEAQEALSERPRLLGSDLLYSHRDGSPIPHSTHWNWWDKVRIAAGMPGLDWYVLKHFAVTQFHLMGWTDEQIAIQCRHNDKGATARKYYMHLYRHLELADMLEKAVDRTKRDAFLARGQTWKQIARQHGVDAA